MTPELVKATLARVTATHGSGKDAETTLTVDRKGIFPVQFNPTSLKLTRQNNIDHGAATTNGQRHQNSSPQPATLSFDLEYDTAEEPAEKGTGKSPPPHTDVRTKTLAIRQFVEPNKDKPKAAPPLIRFTWGKFIFNGIVTQLTEDLDYFSPIGVPLRAKVSVVITEQNPDWEAKIVGPAARDAKTATQPGGGPSKTGPGATPAANPDSAELAQSGESVQELLSRLNADPATWRAAMRGLDSPLGLTAGAQVQLSAQVTAGAGIGMSGGFAASAEAIAIPNLAGALGISGTAEGTAGISEVSAGFALAEGGGVAASVNTVAAANVDASVDIARGSFEVPPISARVTASASASAQSDAVRPPDPRSLSYGASIPLTARVVVVTDDQ